MVLHAARRPVSSVRDSQQHNARPSMLMYDRLVGASGSLRRAGGGSKSDLESAERHPSALIGRSAAVRPRNSAPAARVGLAIPQQPHFDKRSTGTPRQKPP